MWVISTLIYRSTYTTAAMCGLVALEKEAQRSDMVFGALFWVSNHLLWHLVSSGKARSDTLFLHIHQFLSGTSRPLKVFVHALQLVVA